ncbi:MAG: hypothetical protein M1833_004096 [Piccolia ochrophora]|nr:MAG: hypothetical protein M1833_004096 [Piccolia ochrophora]
MTCNITSTPRFVHDPLPVYTPRTRDTETSSIHSAAPSYTSAAPSYRSSIPTAPAHTNRGRHRNHTHNSNARLNNSHFAPGFRPPPVPLRNASVVDPEAHNYAIRSWSSVASSPQQRHYHSVANRRATMANAESERQAIATASATVMRRSPPIECVEDIIEEDPYLVGSEAAERARAERLKRKRERGEEILRQEDKAWDFMISQMADWEERERSWARFRKQAEKPGFLRRRIGFFGRKSM